MFFRDESEPTQADRRLHNSLRLALCCTVFLGLLILGVTYTSSSWIVHAYETRAKTTAVIERARFLSTEIVLIAQRLEQLASARHIRISGRELIQATDRLAGEAAAFDQIVAANGLDSARLDQIRHDAPHRVDGHLATFDVLARELAGDAADGNLSSGSLPQRIATLKRARLDAGFDALVAEHERTVRNQVLALKSGTFILVLVVVGLLLLQWMFSYRPLGQAISGRTRDLLAANAQISHSMLFDELTGLPNRQNLIDRLEEETNPGDPLGIISIDLSRFNEINETFGWGTGDKVLCFVAEVLKQHCLDGEHIARAGASSFIFATNRRPRSEDLETLADLILLSIASRLDISGHKLWLSPVAGITSRIEPDPDGFIDDLLADAEIALEEAGARGGIAHFTPEMRDRIEDRRRIAYDLLQAFERDEIEPFFQPQVDAATGRVAGLEALVRWRHPERGLLSPFVFLDIAESANLGTKLSRVMVHKSLEALAAWRAQGLAIPQVGLNFTAAELRDIDLVERLRFDVDRAGLTPEDVSIEVLESALITGEGDPILETVAGLSRAGFQIDLDDFGTGHASLSNLHLLHVDRLKIDRSFVTDLHEKPETRKLTEAMIRLAENLGIETLAEGVESDQEWAVLQEMGCQTLQGFGIGKPMPAAEIPVWLDAYENATSGASAGAQATGAKRISAA
ncbi:MAG: bifunctional diguanylate cyclase/phosphodiesterase [Pseudomonadota bacterium]